MTEWWSWPLLISVAGTSFAGAWAFINRKGTEKNEARTLHPPTWPEMWEHMKAQDARIDSLERNFNTRSAAITNILRAVVAQWPKGTPAPSFDQADLDALGDTVPSQWAGNSKRK